MERVMSFLNKKNNVLFNVARQKVNSLSSHINDGKMGISLDKNKWQPVIPNDPKSPMIMGMGENKQLIYYPEFSTPYLHQYEKSIKFIEVLSGVVFDKVTGKKYVSGDMLKIYPHTEIESFTTFLDAYVRVCVTEVDEIWERVCS
jgi:hypothetical protein